ncbi:ABC transporter ATP-binding protein [Pseudactinotalea suaedae]|uniref:ABC transporter ATP-binding protein n=1 Tax=Pseudactinotalea suaedae TaxID=1524924 RepID=UPI0012E2E3C5|nr:ATP-binding cassette domain-containing protein [Pseudactinotalea suaedae]
MISLRGIDRSFGNHQVLHDVSFDVAPGRMTGFVGANGSGKTTTMRIILGVLAPSAGSVEVDGVPMGAGYRSRIGYMPEERGLYPKMSLIDQLVYLGELHGLTAADARRRGTDLLERLGLGERLTDTLEALSLGNQQRAQIAAALVHDPIALILDEPFSGLDPMAVETTLEVLRDVADAGAPVLFSSHQLDLVERLCDDLVIISEGRVRASGSREDIRARHSSPEWTLVTTADTGWVRGVPGVEVVEFDGGHVRFRAASAEQADTVLRQAVERGSVLSFSPLNRPLTEIFAEVVR